MTAKAFWGRFIIIPTLILIGATVYFNDPRNQKTDNATIKKQRIEIGMGFLKEIHGRGFIETHNQKIWLIENTKGENIKEDSMVIVSTSPFSIPASVRACYVAEKIRDVWCDGDGAALRYTKQ